VVAKAIGTRPLRPIFLCHTFKGMMMIFVYLKNRVDTPQPWFRLTDKQSVIEFGC